MWDALVLTASNERQACAYESQLAARRRLGMLAGVKRTLVVPDAGGRRIGSGAATLECLRALGGHSGRVLIIHAGGDSRRLPAYGPCGKLFLPVPGERDGALPLTLFDRLAARLLQLDGHVVVAAGDALIELDSRAVSLRGAGLTAMVCQAAPEEAARHGVVVPGAEGLARLYLQKPDIATQRAMGAIDRYGAALLDAGVMSLDEDTCAALLRAFSDRDAYLARSADLYREICCALGTEATLEHYVATARASGSAWSDAELAELYPRLRGIPLRLATLPRAAFLHFGTTRQLIESGLALAPFARQVVLECDNRAPVNGEEIWMEGCRTQAPVTLGGHNVLTGLDIEQPLTLPRGAALDVLEGHTRAGGRCWYIRCSATDDDFKRVPPMFIGRPMDEWLAQMSLTAADIWDAAVPEAQRSLWNARITPASPTADFTGWLWMFDPGHATTEQKALYKAADRYSAEEIAWLTDQDAFHARRAKLRAAVVRGSLETAFRHESGFSAADLTAVMANSGEPEAVADAVRALAERATGEGVEQLAPCRLLHTLGSALGNTAEAAALKDRAFRHLHETILASTLAPACAPRKALAPDETVWGRAPARIELGGGWTDTPPYTLEHGGDVTNVAINLNGQAPIHAFFRVVDERVIRLNSIDGGRRAEIRSFDELTDFRRPGDFFALAKAALVVSGFSPECGRDLEQLLDRFGGGIELTTLVGIPAGSGLGTSSILGAVILGVVRRALGLSLDSRAIFHDVLRLEQALTTGGGWQDQAGGCFGGAKTTSTRPGMIPQPTVRYVPSDVIDPRLNGGATLLYYTGLTRLAKDILEQVVGGYLNRDRAIMQALAEEHEVALAIADAMARKDAAAFGAHVDTAWELQKRLCGTVTNPTIEDLLKRARPHVHGMRISGAGSGGFLLMICKSGDDAQRIRTMFDAEPLNDRARFFDFEVNNTGLEVSTC